MGIITPICSVEKESRTVAIDVPRFSAFIAPANTKITIMSVLKKQLSKGPYDIYMT